MTIEEKSEKPKPISGSKIVIERSDLNDVKAETVSITMGDARDISAKTVTLNRGGVNAVQAEQVWVRQGIAQQISAGERVIIRQGAAAQVCAPTVEVTQGAIGLAQTQNAVCTAAWVGAVAASGPVTLDQSAAKVVVSQKEVSLDQCAAGVLLTQKASVKNSNVVFLIAGRVEGEVKPLFDWTGALAFGAAFGLVAGLILRFKNNLKRGES